MSLSMNNFFSSFEKIKPIALFIFVNSSSSWLKSPPVAQQIAIQTQNKVKKMLSIWYVKFRIVHCN